MYFLKQLLSNPFWPLAAMWRRISPKISNDAFYLKVLYFLEMRGSILHLKQPVLFTEKLQWLKINAYKSEYSKMVDKAAVKEFVKAQIGEQYIIPTIAVWDKVEDIEWDKLPDQFVIKTTHGGGGKSVVVCRNKSTFDRNLAIEKLNKWMPYNAGYAYREKPYINAQAGIIAEKFMANKDNNGDVIEEDLVDYKFYCFNGEPHYCQVIRGRNTEETIDFYDMQWNHMPFVGLNPKVKNGAVGATKPAKLNVMIDIARKLSSNIPFVRIDLYDINNEVYFGEITFYPGGGVGRFNPPIWNRTLGDLLNLDII